ncbi:MAG TPA: class I SAM-dependent methyltransferase [Terriglobia bacterium]|nr:class I SAM-dependent methyltransferase [Terriglobia bacterium]
MSAASSTATASDKSHQHVVTEQFGPRANAYVTSAVHATGPDLQQIADLVRGRSGARVLDLGCGGGHVSFTVAPEVAEVVAYDLSPDMLTAVTRVAVDRGFDNLRTECGAAEKLPFDDAAFGIVATRYSAHHWRDLKVALKEARRVIRPCGFAIFADVVTPGEPLRDTFLQTIEMLRDPSHVRNYSVAEWQAALREAGFEPGEVTTRRLRLEFTSWVTRMQTPELHQQAIRSLQQRMPADIQQHFEIGADGSFTLDTATIVAKPV